MNIDELIRRYSEDLVKSYLLGRLKQSGGDRFILVSEANAISGAEINNIVEMGFKILGMVTSPPSNQIEVFFKLI